MATALTATIQPQYGRVLLQLTFTTVTQATVSRVHADGTVWPLRAANPVAVTATSGIGAIIFDHELPLDSPVTYRAASTQSPGTTVTTSAVTLAADTGYVTSTIWLTHPLKPSLSMLVPCTDMGERSRPGRIGVLPIIGRADPIAVTDTRQSGTGAMTLLTTTSADATKLRALVADGSVLLARTPGSWANPWQYIAVGDLTEASAAGVGPEPHREWKLSYTVVSAPAGVGQGAVGATWDDVKAAYPTWAALIAGEPTWRDLQIKAGP